MHCDEAARIVTGLLASRCARIAGAARIVTLGLVAGTQVVLMVLRGNGRDWWRNGRVCRML